MRRGVAGTLAGTCGVAVFHSFQTSNPWCTDTAKTTLGYSGIGYAIAGFVNTLACELAYTEIAKECKIVFQSPVKVNQNSGRKFFFIVYTKKGGK